MSANPTPTGTKSPWIPVAQFATLGYEWPSVSTLRTMYRDRNSNGFADAFAQHGRIALVSPARLFALIENSSAAAVSPAEIE